MGHTLIAATLVALAVERGEVSPRPGRVVARFELDFVHRFAASGDTRAIVTSPEFGNLREEIRGILHNADTIRSAA